MPALSSITSGRGTPQRAPSHSGVAGTRRPAVRLRGRATAAPRTPHPTNYQPFHITVMNWLDLVILLVLAWFAIAGATAGLPRELVTLLAMLLGVVLAGLFHERLATDLLLFIDREQTARVAAFAAIFFAVLG